MMGSAEALPEEPAVRPMFVEDMTEEQLASAVSEKIASAGRSDMAIKVFCFDPSIKALFHVMFLILMA